MHRSDERPIPAGPFLGPCEPFDAGAAEVVALTAAFHPDRFEQRHYARLGVPFPPALKGATRKRRAEHLAGRALAQAALRLAGEPVAPISIGPGGAPVWPGGAAGAISHASGRAMCVLRPGGGCVGADTEVLAEGRALRAIRRLVFSADDAARSEASDGLEGDVRTTLLFSAKETLFKLLYPTVGRSFGFACATLIAPARDGRMVLRLARALHPALPEGARFEVRYTVGRTHVTTWAMLSKHPEASRATSNGRSCR